MKPSARMVRLPQSGRRSSFGHLKQQKESSSPPTSSQSSEDDFLSPPRTRSKPSPCRSRGAVSTATAAGRRVPPVERPGEEERQRWRKFREKKTPYRSAVVGLHPRKPRSNPSEPSECGAPPRLLFLAPAALPHRPGSASLLHLSSSCAVERGGRRGPGRRRRWPGRPTGDLGASAGRRIDTARVKVQPPLVLSPE